MGGTCGIIISDGGGGEKGKRERKRERKREEKEEEDDGKDIYSLRMDLMIGTRLHTPI